MTSHILIKSYLSYKFKQINKNNIKSKLLLNVSNKKKLFELNLHLTNTILKKKKIIIQFNKLKFIK